MLRRFVMLLCVVALALFSVGPALAVQMTTFADIGNNQGGTTSYGFALNSSGVVAGYATTPSIGITYTYTGGMVGQSPMVYNRSINDSGQVASCWFDGATYKTALWNAGTMINLDGAGLSQGSCVNNNTIVGGKTNTSNATIWFDPIANPTVYTDLRTALVATYSAGTGGQNVVAMNNNYALVGFSQGLYTKGCLYNLTTHAFIAPASGGLIPGLGGNNAFPGSASAAASLQGGGTGISSNFDTAGNGWIAGAGNDPSQAGNAIRAFVGKLNGTAWTMTRVGSLGNSSTTSRAWDVNASGEAVGFSYLSGGSGPINAFIWDSVNGIRNLNTVYASIIPAGWTLNYASDINDAGWITGYGTDSIGNTHGFLLYTPVPEPLTLLLLGTGLVGLVAYAWRKRR